MRIIAKHLENFNDVTLLESHVFFHGLRKGEETVLHLEEGKDLIIKLLDILTRMTTENEL
jgi:pyruvate carboxylase